MKLAELKARLHIDKDDLDTELVEQAELYYQVAHAHIEAVSDRDAQKEHLKQLEAKVSVRVRKTLAAGEGKVTEAQVGQGVLNDKEFQGERQKFLDISRESAELEVLKESFHARGFALTTLTQYTMARMASEGSSSMRDAAAADARTRSRPRVRNTD